ncbi:transmembrane 6 superfamily member 1-like isoform X2 [Scleropages formosus]|uniref:transmembrane 6 superfamily member 1-like isoform X2 n=1 Tax=Scleropages formosus TaxID=113540 RepID=UPI0010FAA467|nr:transmembrane 6 superfamily member 1-like isoform X2 [Scleropages formosus]
MNLPQEICVFFFSMSALGVLYVMNNIAAFQEPLAILAIGAALSGAVVLLAFLSVRHRPPKDLLFYLCVEFSFASVMKLTSALEQDGFTRGFTEFYQRTGEPYMVTAYAIMMCYWDGVVHFLLYLLLLRRMSRTAPYRSAGLFWAGSCFASMAVFIPGTVIGKYGSSTHPASWLNGRFLLGAAWAGLSLLRRPRELPPVAVDVAEREQRKGVLSRPVDLLLTLLLLAAMAFSAFRGLVSAAASVASVASVSLPSFSVCTSAPATRSLLCSPCAGGARLSFGLLLHLHLRVRAVPEGPGGLPQAHDAALPVLRPAADGCVCLRPVDTRMRLDARLDRVVRGSRRSGPVVPHRRLPAHADALHLPHPRGDVVARGPGQSAVHGDTPVTGVPLRPPARLLREERPPGRGDAGEEERLTRGQTDTRTHAHARCRTPSKGPSRSTPYVRHALRVLRCET